MFIELGISILVAIAILFRLISHYFRNKKKQSDQKPLDRLKSSVIKYEAATEPVEVDDWENV